MAAGVIGLIGFVLPWASCPGIQDRISASGYELASKGGASSLWIVPICLLAAIGLAVLQIISQKARYAVGIVAAGVGSLMTPLLKYLLTVADIQNDRLGLQRFAWEQIRFEAGVFLSLAASLAVTLGGVLMLTEAEAVSGKAVASGRRSGPRSSWILACVFALPLATVALQRMALSVLTPVLRNEFAVGVNSIGTLFTATSISFAVGATLSGLLIDKLGLRVGATLFLIACSIGQACSVLGGFSGLLGARVLFGLGGGAALPIAAKVVSSYIRKNEQVLGVALWQSVTCIGVLSAVPLCVQLNISEGWRSVFLLTAIPGVVLAILAFAFIRPAETDHAPGSLRLDSGYLRIACVYAVAMLLNGTVLQTWSASFLVQKQNVSLSQVPAILYPMPLYAALGAVVGAALFVALRNISGGRGVAHRQTAITSAVVVLCSVLLLPFGGAYVATLALNFASFGIGALLVSVYSGVLESRLSSGVGFSIGLISTLAAALQMAASYLLGWAMNKSGLPVISIVLAAVLVAASILVPVNGQTEEAAFAAKAR